MKYIFTTVLLLCGYIGFSQSNTGKKNLQVTFTNGDESIVIIPGKKANVLRLTTNDQTARFGSLELSSHEVVHQKELPELNPGLDNLVGNSQKHIYLDTKDRRQTDKRGLNEGKGS